MMLSWWWRNAECASQKRGRKITLHGSGLNTRNYLYVEDVARAFDVILHKGVVGDVYNIGGHNEKSNIEVAQTLLKELGVVDKHGGDLEAACKAEIEYVEDRPFNDLRYPLDCSRLAALGWVEEVSFDDGLRRTIEWYEHNSGNWGSIEDALVAHPRRGLLPQVVVSGHTTTES
jgi:UDP-glucose 4,6-dehydratase